jgi:hypothetical protein
MAGDRLEPHVRPKVMGDVVGAAAGEIRDAIAHIPIIRSASRIESMSGLSATSGPGGVRAPHPAGRNSRSITTYSPNSSTMWMVSRQSARPS